MDVQKKINLINTLHYRVDMYEIDDKGKCFYVYVPLDDETIYTLKELGKSESWIDSEREYDDEDRVVFDLTKVGFEFANYWYEDIGFSLEERI